MRDKLDAIAKRYQEVSDLIVQPDIVSDQTRYVKLTKEYKDLQKIVLKDQNCQKLKADIAGAKKMLREESDPEFRELARQELEELEPQLEPLEEELKMMLLPKDPDDDKNAIFEIRSGTGGDEAALFAGDLYKMYRMFFEQKGWQVELLNFTEGTAGGYKEISVMVSGEEVFGQLKFEAGVHRVQRVPATESQGRVHTSAATVAVLPETEEVDVEINMNDIKKDTFRASGAGGQHINKTESAIRLTHLPTGIVAECQDGRSQHKNYEKALSVLRSRIYQMEQDKQNAEVSAARKSMVRSGDRSEKIRTYNFPQGRVTDHRINYTVYNLQATLGGDLDGFVERLRMAENAEKMQAAADEIF
ncbi:MAG: peptide chain release factor 1 [Bernardetiaceae bacterium]